MSIKHGTITLTEHQEQAVRKLSSGSILCGGVGSGKTYTSIMWYLENCPEKKLIVITTAVNRDLIEPGHKKSAWAESIENCGIKEDNYIIDSWNNIKKYRYLDNICYLFDEQRLVGYGAWSRTFIQMVRHCKNISWLLLSATPGENWMDYMVVFIANGFYKNKSDFTQHHVVWKPYMKYPVIDYYVGEAVLDMYRKKLLVNINNTDRHTKRHRHYIICNYDQKAYNILYTTLQHPETGLPIESTGEYIHLARKILNTNQTRIDATKKLINQNPKSIIFYNFKYERELLIQICEELRIDYGQRNGQVHDNLPNGDKWVYLVQYTSGAEGWNCTQTDCIIFYSLNYSYKKTEQAEGRIDRMNTPFIDLHYYFMTSKSVLDMRIERSINDKKKFSEKAFEKEFNLKWS